jgi:hypothetical protein
VQHCWVKQKHTCMHHSASSSLATPHSAADLAEPGVMAGSKVSHQTP